MYINSFAMHLKSNMQLLRKARWQAQRLGILSLSISFPFPCLSFVEFKKLHVTTLPRPHYQVAY